MVTSIPAPDDDARRGLRRALIGLGAIPLTIVLVGLAILTAILSGKEAMGMGPVRAVREDW